MNPNNIEVKRLHQLNGDVARAKTIMQHLHEAYPTLTFEHWNAFNRLIRIHTDAAAILDIFRRASRFGLCRHALSDLEMIKDFIQDYRKHFPKKRNGFLLRSSFNQPPSTTHVKQGMTLKSNQNDTKTNSCPISADPVTGAQQKRGVSRQQNVSNYLQEREVIDLTIDSDESGSSVNSKPKVRNNGSTAVSISVEPQDDDAPVTSRSEGQKTYSIETAPIEVREWYEYELRRGLVLWYEPLQHLDQDMLP